MQKSGGGANEAAKVFVELIKIVKIAQFLLKNSANSALFASFLYKS